ncbi:MAG: hypothetical protein IPK69_09695 [Phycisphaerales bacterium]|nr:MAG: hypothetical protein IPK69_09695 [Phycisphaerales bacterium]
MSVATFPCLSCGAELEFKPGTNSLTCPYCHGLNEIPELPEGVEEQDFQGMLGRLDKDAEHVDRLDVPCGSCGAVVELPENVTSAACPFCGSNVVATGASHRIIKPQGVLPFGIARDKAQSMFREWIGGLWFAPSDLKQLAAMTGVELSGGRAMSGAGSSMQGSVLSGVYLPYWTFDAKTTTPYTGQRGDAYYETQSYTAMVNGRPQPRTRQVRKIRWSWASGTVFNVFDDVLVPATGSLPQKTLTSLGSWDTKDVVAYNDAFLSGFRAESYTVTLAEGFSLAQRRMERMIEDTIRRDIGGDEQRIHSMSPHYQEITFKHVLVPVWISSYRYRGKIFRFIVNARSGRIAAERPYSGWKITLAVVLALIAIGVVVLVVASQR